MGQGNREIAIGVGGFHGHLNGSEVVCIFQNDPMVCILILEERGVGREEVKGPEEELKIGAFVTKKFNLKISY